MARPRIFISSTHYDLNQIRLSLSDFIKSLGYDSVLSEKGNIPYIPHKPLDESCYKEVSNADIFVLIIGGRYGSGTSASEVEEIERSKDKYESITKKEYKKAIDELIPCYILVDRKVYCEYEFYKKNKNNGTNFNYTDSVNVFRFIEEIESQKNNNPLHIYDEFKDIEIWLKEQWAGLFCELLKIVIKNKGYIDFSETHKSTKETKKEQLLQNQLNSHKGIQKNKKVNKLNNNKITKDEKIREIQLIKYITNKYSIELNLIIEVALSTSSHNQFANVLAERLNNSHIEKHLVAIFKNKRKAIDDLNSLRKILKNNTAEM